MSYTKSMINLGSEGNLLMNPPSFLAETMPFWPKNHKESLTKQLTSKLLSNSERNRIEEDLTFLESMMTDRVATFGVNDVRLE